MVPTVHPPHHQAAMDQESLLLVVLVLVGHRLLAVMDREVHHQAVTGREALLRVMNQASPHPLHHQVHRHRTDLVGLAPVMNQAIHHPHPHLLRRRHLPRLLLHHHHHLHPTGLLSSAQDTDGVASGILHDPATAGILTAMAAPLFSDRRPIRTSFEMLVAIGSSWTKTT